MLLNTMQGLCHVGASWDSRGLHRHGAHISQTGFSKNAPLRCYLRTKVVREQTGLAVLPQDR
jgi:hypothetical protein